MGKRSIAITSAYKSIKSLQGRDIHALITAHCPLRLMSGLSGIFY